MNKRSKYGVADAIDRTYNGKVYDSKLEMLYRKHLEIMKKAADPKQRVVKIKEQFAIEITINKEKICKYLADFVVQYADGRVEYIDVKGIRTDIYKLKKKMVEAMYDIKIKEVGKGQF